MVGFLDLEANVDSDFKRNRTIFDIIEIGFTSDNKSINFHTFVKPKENDGNLFNRITELTGITQEQVDRGMLSDKALGSLVDLCNKVEEIYTWGSYDSYLLRKNSKYCKSIKGKVYRLSMRIKDLGSLVQAELNLKSSISLINTAHLLNININSHHSAEDDCELLRLIYINRGNYNKELLQEYVELDKKRTKTDKIIFEYNHFRLVNTNNTI